MRKCPKCGELYNAPPALSRRDNKTEICPDCGMREALEDWYGSNKTFYFTYDTEGQPFAGGWTAIEAPDRASACALFRAYHPDRTDGLLNCSSVYDSTTFYKTGMFETGNFGVYCHERITVKRVTND